MKTDELNESEQVVNAFAVIIGFALEPFVAVSLWRWFIMPYGLPPLNWSTAFGINLLLALWVSHYQKRTDRENYAAAQAVIGRALICFALGWIVMKLR